VLPFLLTAAHPSNQHSLRPIGIIRDYIAATDHLSTRRKTTVSAGSLQAITSRIAMDVVAFLVRSADPGEDKERRARSSLACPVNVR